MIFRGPSVNFPYIIPCQLGPMFQYGEFTVVESFQSHGKKRRRIIVKYFSIWESNTSYILKLDTVTLKFSKIKCRFLPYITYISFVHLLKGPQGSNLFLFYFLGDLSAILDLAQ
jgi:hypothetical protein